MEQNEQAPHHPSPSNGLTGQDEGHFVSNEPDVVVSRNLSVLYEDLEHEGEDTAFPIHKHRVCCISDMCLYIMNTRNVSILGQYTTTAANNSV